MYICNMFNSKVSSNIEWEGVTCRCYMFVFEYRLAEKYKESLTTKEKIQKSIEVKKEHLRSLQPGLNNIMQV